MSIQRVFLMRHGETAWGLSGRHTGVTDIPLTESGRKVARMLAPVLARVAFARVFSSPLQRHPALERSGGSRSDAISPAGAQPAAGGVRSASGRTTWLEQRGESVWKSEWHSRSRNGRT
jgi:bisphosphoglycerate-dependent phosphoglycerate mutase